ncbi:hypothetical protein LCGC14_3024120, partial [marine sediment metagenome]
TEQAAEAAEAAAAAVENADEEE